MPWPKGMPFHEEQKRKISEAMKVRKLSDEHKRKIGLAHKGMHQSEEAKRKQSEAMKGRPSKIKGIPKSEEHKKKLSEVKTGIPNLKLKGVPKSPEHIEKMRINALNRSPETLQKMRDAKLGIPLSAIHRERLGDAHRGEKSTLWKGGISFDDYCPKFNEGFRRRTRAYWNNICVNCGKTKEENRNTNMTTHHVDYNKKMCCDDSTVRVVTLCTSCHSKSTQSNREHWKQHFGDIINKQGGKCYYTKEEYKNILMGVS